jgi:hypothetical protein
MYISAVLPTKEYLELYRESKAKRIKKIGSYNIRILFLLNQFREEVKPIYFIHSCFYK